MQRRDFIFHSSAAAAAFALPGCAQTHAATSPQAPWAGIEAASGGRLGVAVLHDGVLQGHRLDERFPMCSTFKWVAAACVLQRVDRGQEQLDRRIPYGREALQPHSPITSQHVGAGMTLAELCHATITVSDNCAGNLILATYGGPEGFTRFVRGLGDSVTRLDRWETKLNDAIPGDPRDTTTPRAMAQLLHTLLLGDALSPRSRNQLAQWMEATETNRKRLKVHLPAGWRMGSKTGTGDRGTTNDVGIFWPPSRKPIVVAAYLTQTEAPEAARNNAIAQVGRHVVGAA